MIVLNLIFGIIATSLLSDLVSGQLGPTPPRLNIPGAITYPFNQPQYRSDKPVSPIRIRRPIPRKQSPQFIPSTISPRIFDEKPVTESAEEDSPFIPSILQPQPQQPYTQTTIFSPEPIHSNALISASPNTLLSDALDSLEQELSIGRFPDRHIQQPSPTPQILHTTPTPPQYISRPSTTALPTEFNGFSGIQRFGIERQSQPSPPPTTRPIVRVRPQKAQQPQYDNYPDASPVHVTRAPSVARTHNNHREVYQRPAVEHNSIQDTKKKPVAQIIRKYREEHEDGTITWGYENDDGSFKEEIIGMDCITRGTYGYIDPEGNKREYQYETGIKCDPNKRDQEDDDDEEAGFVNYEENKAVLPNGLEIDLASMGKKKSKRPGAVLYQQYRN